MRLGDLDALKEKIWRSDVSTREKISNLIDNAPTVEPCYQTTTCLDCKMYDKEKHNCPRFCEVIRSAIEERPQGEWLDIYSTHIAYECSNCHMQMPICDYFNFCPNCGADMRGVNNENV